MRNSGHATSPLLGGLEFGSGELGPYVAPGSGAETDRSASRTSYQADAAQKQSQQRFAHSAEASAAPQQPAEASTRQAAGYALQDLGRREHHTCAKAWREPPHNGVNSRTHEGRDWLVDPGAHSGQYRSPTSRPSPPALQRRQVVSPPDLCPGEEEKGRGPEDPPAVSLASHRRDLCWERSREPWAATQTPTIMHPRAGRGPKDPPTVSLASRCRSCGWGGDPKTPGRRPENRSWL